MHLLLTQSFISCMCRLFFLFLVQLDEMNGKMIGRKPLYVAVAQHKEERKARLQVIFLRTYFDGHIGKTFVLHFESAVGACSFLFTFDANVLR